MPFYRKQPAGPNASRIVDSERGGLLNLNRQFVASADPPSIVWLRYTIDASHSMTKRASLGWIGEVWIFVNGKLLTQGRNFYEPEGERRNPDARMSFENGSFDVPLQAGSNEIAIALYSSVHEDLRSRTQYGWGLMMRFSDPRGLSFPRLSGKNAP